MPDMSLNMASNQTSENPSSGFKNIDKSPGGNLLQVKQEGAPKSRKLRIRKLLEMGIPKQHITRD